MSDIRHAARLIPVLLVLICAGIVFGDAADDQRAREEAANRKLIEARKARERAATTTRPTTQPGAGSPATQAAGKKSDRVVFVIDATGSMSSQLPSVRDEVGKALSALKPDQFFGIVIFSEHAASRFEKQMMPATEANVRRAYAFLQSVDASGPGNPAPGIAAAAAMNPDVVWLITDGDWDDEQEPIKATLAAVAPGRLRINTTIKFAGKNDSGCELIEKISLLGRGICVDGEGKRVRIALTPSSRSPSSEPPSGKSIFQE